ncbi:DUF1217 domain-containing protein [Celeribacter arenosi]|uniref:DUF1217 domain-containing protein n=1 Tax=Celeribacter arenosi TaxID=792649 RepID=A0ABP7JYA4_9RHOB
MTYQPVVPLSGYAGWAFLARTETQQRAAFAESKTVQRDTNYFEENIGKVETAADLMADRRLLSVALGAFGLGDDINNKYFIQKVLEDGTLDSDALSNRLTDKRYHAFSEAFGFGNFDVPNTSLSTFAPEITQRYLDQEFEVAIGEQDESLRLALSLDRELGEIAAKDTSDDGRWYTVMGNTPIRTVFETALGLPSSFGALDLDQQLDTFRDKSEQYFETSEVADFADSEKRGELIRLFLLRSDISSANSGMSPAATALSLLSNY